MIATASRKRATLSLPRSAVTARLSSLFHGINAASDVKTYPLGLSGLSKESFVFSSPKLCVGSGIAAKAVKSAMHALGMKNPLIISGSCGLERLPKDLQAVLLKKDLDVSPLAPLPEFGIQTEFSFRESTGNCIQINVKSEPTVNSILAGTSVAILQNCDGVIAVGGGSVIDTGKAISAMITNHGDIYDHLDAVGTPKSLNNLPVPLITVPTVSGSGAEITSKAFLRCPKHDRTLALHHETMAPNVVVVDPKLALSSPPRETGWSGFNALYQVIAGYIGDDSNPLVDSLCMEGIVRISRALPVAVRDGSDARAREDLALGSVFCGLVHDNCRLGTVYGIASALGGYGGARSALCAFIFPRIFVATINKSEKILKELQEKPEPTLAEIREKIYLSRMLYRTTSVAQVLTGSEAATVADMGRYLCDLKEKLDIPALHDIYEFQDDMKLRSVAERAVAFSGTEGYTVELTVDEVEAILKEALQK